MQDAGEGETVRAAQGPSLTGRLQPARHPRRPSAKEKYTQGTGHFDSGSLRRRVVNIND